MILCGLSSHSDLRQCRPGDSGGRRSIGNKTDREAGFVACMFALLCDAYIMFNPNFKTWFPTGFGGLHKIAWKTHLKASGYYRDRNRYSRLA